MSKVYQQRRAPELVETVLHTIWKEKGPAEKLKNNRFVYMKHPIDRACAKMRSLRRPQFNRSEASLVMHQKNASSLSRASSGS